MSAIVRLDVWPKLRDIIKYKVDKVWVQCNNSAGNRLNNLQNTTLLLNLAEQDPAIPRATSPTPTATGGLRLPPFSPRKRDELNPNEAPKSRMNEQEANELKGFIFAQMEEFEE